MCSNRSKVCNVGLIDFVVVKINGNHVNQMSRCEAVQTFLQSNETIIVELCRRNETTSANGCGDGNNIDLEQLIILTKPENDNSQFERSSVSPDVITPSLSSTYDNEIILTLQANGGSGCDGNGTSVIANNDGPLLKSIQTKETQTECKTFDILSHQQHIIAREMTDRFIEQEHNLFEQCLEPEIDIEEITLSKSVGSKEPLGLTICYSGGGSGGGTCSNSGSASSGAVGNTSNSGARALSSSDDNETTEVFISDIQADSLAARDGRLRRGDQILQINGKDIKGKDETERIIMENNNSVTLLVSRYLYGEDAECSDDEDEEEYYVENNIDYANGFLINDYTNVVDKLDKVLIRQVQGSDIHEDKMEKLLVENIDTRNVELNAADINATVNSTDCKEETVKGTRTTEPCSNLKQQLQKGAITKTITDEQRTQVSMISQEEEMIKTSALSKNSSQIMSRISNVMNAKKQDYDENEHIYETIPEDSESEPFYCSPYQSSTYMTAGGSCSSAATTEVIELQQQKQRVAQWLGIKPISSTIAAGRSNSRSTIQRSGGRNGTLRSAITNTTSGSSSSGGQQNLELSNPIENELENSSSAYNTGGSNNSVSPLALMLNKQHGVQESEFNLNAKVRATNYTIGCKTHRLPSPKEQNVSSPKTNLLLFGRQFTSTDNHFRNKTTVDDQQLFSKTLLRSGQQQPQPQPHGYRNTLQQHQYKHFERQQQQPSSQFNAPNLSQYHFVSSQEVTTAANINPSSSPKINLTAMTSAAVPPVQKSVSDNLPDTTPMVWKVKRRPDGSRYIVRRPVRNRLPASVRRNVRNNDITTTEDDTISEVKIGRYWTKEERKRHIERARERRNHQQQQQQQL